MAFDDIPIKQEGDFLRAYEFNDLMAKIKQIVNTGILDIGSDRGINFKRGSGNFNAQLIQPNNIAFDNVLADGTYLAYGRYLSGDPRLLSSYADNYITV